MGHKNFLHGSNRFACYLVTFSYCRAPAAAKDLKVACLRASYRAVLPTLLITERAPPLFGFGFFISAIAIADRQLRDAALVTR